MVGPAAGAPVIDHAGLADIGLEALGLAHRRVCGAPKETRVVSHSGNSSFGQALIGIENSVGSPDIKIDESEEDERDGL